MIKIIHNEVCTNPRDRDCYCVRMFLLESNLIEDEPDDVSFKYAMKAWEYAVTQEELSERMIMKIHKILMKPQNTIPDAFKGQFRDGWVRVGMRVCPDPKLVPGLLDVWIKKVTELMKRPLEHSDLIHHHVQFEKIHPFFDGNGRVGRILYNWERLKKYKAIDIIENDTKYSKYYTIFNDYRYLKDL